MTHPLYTSQDIEKATGSTIVSEVSVTGVSIDTRTLQKGDVFIALKGEQHDGHRFVAEALEKGAAAVIVQDIPENLPEDAVIITVSDTQQALWDLAAYNRARSNATYIGVTGSVGKSSVKEMLYTVLKQQGDAYVNPGNFNNHIGLPLSLARMPQDATFGIYELGMNHAGEIAALTRLLQSHIAVITAVEAVHLEFFDSVEGIAHAKAEICEGVVQGGSIILPRDNPHYPILLETAKAHHIDTIYTFGKDASATLQLVQYVSHASGEQVTAECDGETLEYTLPLRGEHQALNSLVVLGIVHALNLPLAQASAAFTQITPMAGRGKRAHLTLADMPITLIDDSYNASPVSMHAALVVLAQEKGRKIAVLGDMLELGDDEQQMHAALAQDIIASDIDLVFTAGTRIRALHDALPSKVAAAHHAAALDLLPVLQQTLQEGDTILIKGSHGSNMWQLVEALQHASENNQPETVT